MDQHDWSEWQDDASSLGEHDSPSLEDSGAASLGEHGSGSLTDHDAGFEPDTVDLGDGYDPSAHPAGQHEAPLPDDSYEGDPDSAEPHTGSTDTHDAPVVDEGPSAGIGTAENAQHPADGAPADHPAQTHQTDPDAAPHERVDALVGADPDVDPTIDSDWQHDPFPPSVELTDPPEPVDGYPWTDASSLGSGGHDVVAEQPAYGAPPSAELLDYAGIEQPADGGDAWSALISSDDPAASSLARWWSPTQ